MQSTVSTHILQTNTLDGHEEGEPIVSLKRIQGEPAQEMEELVQKQQVYEIIEEHISEQEEVNKGSADKEFITPLTLEKKQIQSLNIPKGAKPINQADTSIQALGKLQGQVNEMDLQKVTDKSNVTTKTIEAKAAVKDTELTNLKQVKDLLKEVPTPTLQSVTAEGNTTTTRIVAAPAQNSNELITKGQVDGLIRQIPRPEAPNLQSVTARGNWTDRDIFITKHSAGQGALLGLMSAKALPRINSFYGIAVDSQGFIYLAQSYVILKWTKDLQRGIIVAGRYAEGDVLHTLGGGLALTVDKEGNMYILDSDNYRVVLWAKGATEGIVVAGGNGRGSALNQVDGFNGPRGMFVDSEGNIYLLDDKSHRVILWAKGATEGIVVAGGNGRGSALNQFFSPSAIIVDRQGTMFVADENNYRIVAWAKGATEGIVVAGGNGRGSALNQMGGLVFNLAFDSKGNLYVADQINRRVTKWQAGATEGVVVARESPIKNRDGSTSMGLLLIFIDASDTLYVAVSNKSQITKYINGATTGIVLKSPQYIQETIQIKALGNTLHLNNADQKENITLVLNNQIKFTTGKDTLDISSVTGGTVTLTINGKKVA